jgi:hypothetical protein
VPLWYPAHLISSTLQSKRGFVMVASGVAVSAVLLATFVTIGWGVWELISLRMDESFPDK